MDKSKETFDLGIESFKIFLRWDQARKNGDTDHSIHRALPAERDREQELQQRLKSDLKTDPGIAIKVNGQIEVLGEKGRAFSAIGALQVKWTPAGEN